MLLSSACRTQSQRCPQSVVFSIAALDSAGQVVARKLAEPISLVLVFSLVRPAYHLDVHRAYSSGGSSCSGNRLFRIRTLAYKLRRQETVTHGFHTSRSSKPDSVLLAVSVQNEPLARGVGRRRAQFVKLRPADLRPIPVSLPVEVIAQSPEQAIEKLKRLVPSGRWRSLADAVRLFEDGVEVDSFIPRIDQAA